MSSSDQGGGFFDSLVVKNWELRARQYQNF